MPLMWAAGVRVIRQMLSVCNWDGYKPMLHLDKERSYVVYPTFAHLKFSWDDLPTVLADPYSHSEFGRANYTVERLQSFGWVFPPQQCELIPGPCGNGIIVVHAPPRSGWYAGTLLSLTTPQGIRMEPDWRCSVTYVEPRDEPGWELGLGKKAKYYPFGASGEHTEAAGDAVFWLLRVRPSKRSIKGLSDLPQWAKHFGIDVTPVSDVPQKVLDEVAQWRDPEREQYWFKVEKGGDVFDWQFAAMLYCGLHLVYVGGPRVRSMHIISTIQGEPGPYAKYICKKTE
jgi:hypothetical protein